MAVSRLSKQSIQTGFPKQQTIWDQSTSIAGMDALGSVTIATPTTSNQSNTILFSNIPQTYTHLQLRGTYRDTWGVTGYGEFYAFPNSDSGAGHYADHYVQGNGSSPTAASLSNRSDGMFLGQGVRGGSLADTFGSFIVDFLDYTNTNKFKTARSVGGADLNGSGIVIMQSAIWLQTTAISSLLLTANGYGFAQYSRFSLYGVK